MVEGVVGRIVGKADVRAAVVDHVAADVNGATGTALHRVYALGIVRAYHQARARVAGSTVDDHVALVEVGISNQAGLYEAGGQATGIASGFHDDHVADDDLEVRLHVGQNNRHAAQGTAGTDVGRGQAALTSGHAGRRGVGKQLLQAQAVGRKINQQVFWYYRALPRNGDDAPRPWIAGIIECEAVDSTKHLYCADIALAQVEVQAVLRYDSAGVYQLLAGGLPAAHRKRKQSCYGKNSRECEYTPVGD